MENLKVRKDVHWTRTKQVKPIPVKSSFKKSNKSIKDIYLFRYERFQRRF